MQLRWLPIFAACACVAAGIQAAAAATATRSDFGRMPDGREVEAVTLRNDHGITVRVITYGARVQEVVTPDRFGHPADIALGFPSLQGYLSPADPYFGATVGRFANRVAKGRFTLEGREYQLATNNGPNHLHGGPLGFGHLMWHGEPIESADRVGVRFSLHSPDGDEGYPGALDATVAYTLSDKNELRMEYTAETDKPTIVNLTNHCYWNLAGDGAGDILGHEVTIAAERYLPVDATAIPTGQLAPVKGTVMDFTQGHKVGDRIAETDNGPGSPKGYDHCYVLGNEKGALAFAARVKDPKSGRVMEIWTTEPGIQFYTGNFLDGDPINGGYHQHAALCLEAEHYPDSPNRPEFPSTELKPGQKYRQTTVHKFFVE